MSAGSANIGTVGDPTTGLCAHSIAWDINGNLTNFTVVNNSAGTVKSKIVGWAADGTEDPAKSYTVIVAPGASAQQAIPNGAIPLVVNSRGHLVGYNTYLGIP